MNLDGLWGFRFDPQAEGEAQNWQNGLPSPISMPVPASFSDLFAEGKYRDYCGDFWYETEFYLPPCKEGDRQYIRFGTITHRAVVWCNGQQAASHEGGFLPVVVDVTDLAVRGQANKLVVKVNNELNEYSIPVGNVKVMKDGSKRATPYYDFFNYAGIHRSVFLVQTPKEAVQDYSVTYGLEGDDALVHYTVKTSGEAPVEVQLIDAEGNVVAKASGKEGTLRVKDAHLWQVRNAYLYTFSITIKDGERVVDAYAEKIGIRTVEIRGSKIFINQKPVYLKGYGKHEDAEIIGKAFNYGIAKRDFECMKWNGANCFRTSHYPYADEWYQMADEEGFLIIDEVPAVGMMRSTTNFLAAGQGQYTSFFEAPTVPKLQEVHIQQIEEMMTRDKNHPSVFAWSLFNEPETFSEYANKYFGAVFEAARTMDPQRRPMTGALEKNSSPEECQVYQFCDFVCLNRYYGWYIEGGELETAREEFIEEMDKWADKKLDVPFVFTEFGTDTLATEHKLPGVMWSQEYQVDYLKMNFEVFDRYDFVQGELVWNFADFQTSQGVFRVNGNKKGVFSRNRQPKDAAFIFKKRWEEIPE